MPRLTFDSKPALATWCKDNGIQLAKPITLKKGWFTISPVVPPGVPDCFNIMQYVLCGPNPPVHSHDGRKFGPGGAFVPMTPEEVTMEDARVARLNEIQALVFFNLNKVHLDS